MSRMMGFEAGRFERPNRYLLAVGFLLVFLTLYLIFWSFVYKPDEMPSGRLFRGYWSWVIRIPPTNLSMVEEHARNNQFDVEVGDRHKDDEYYETYSFLDGGRFYLSYGIDSDTTGYHYTYISNETGRLNRFWERFGYYFNMSSSRLAQVKSSIMYEEDLRGKDFGGEIKGKPLWSRVIEDAGEEFSRDTSRVGVLEIEYNTTGRLWLRTKYLQISTTLEGDVKCILMIDEDSDVRLFIKSKEKIDDPRACFIPLFEAIGIPDSVLYDFKFEEDYAAFA